MISSKLRILVVDDHPVVRAGVRELLRSAIDAEFVEADNARSAIMAATKGTYDVILLDVTLSDRSGLDIIRDLQRAQPKARILVLSMHTEHQFATRALRAGAAGYITKSSLSENLIKAVRKVMAGGLYTSEAIGEHLAAMVARSPRSGIPLHEGLSSREFEVLRMIAEGKSGKEIANALSLSFKTVSTYRSRILGKLGLRTNADLIRYAIQNRLVESPV